MTAAPVLGGGRLRLRGWDEKDFGPYRDLVTDAERMRFVGGGAITEAEARSEYREMRDRWAARGIGIFVVADAKSDRPLGFTGLFESPLLAEPELCWSLFPGCEGMGFATEAAALARDWAYREKGLGPLMSLVHPKNRPSRAVAERLGATIECRSSWLGKPRLVYRHLVPG